MMTAGQVSLNLSFLIYIILYLPQILHNQKQINLDGLSKWMHLLLYLAYSLDLIYGFGAHLPWQYRAVSAIGWLLLNIQHLQIIYHFQQKQQTLIAYGYYSTLLLSTTLVSYSIAQQPFPSHIISYIGYNAQLGFIFALIPQILKCRKLQSALAINFIYLLFNLIIACLDLISAWKLEWGWPNKLGSTIILSLTGILLLQQYRYRHASTK